MGQVRQEQARGPNNKTKTKRGVRLEILTIGEPAEYSRPAVARKPRIEIAGGLYHLITRGNNRQRIFQSHDDHLKFLRLLERQKAKLPFYVYAYCLMPNHVHLLAEMRSDFCTNGKSRKLVMIKEAM